MLAGLRIVRCETGERPGLVTSIVRTPAQVLTALTLGVGYALSHVDAQRRALHDRIASTIVIER